MWPGKKGRKVREKEREDAQDVPDRIPNVRSCVNERAWRIATNLLKRCFAQSIHAPGSINIPSSFYLVSSVSFGRSRIVRKRLTLTTRAERARGESGNGKESSGRLNMYTPMHILTGGIGKDRGGFANRPAARCAALACNRAGTARSRDELMTAREHTRDSTAP